MTKLFTIVIILYLSFSSIHAETIISEPIEIWSEEQSEDSKNTNNISVIENDQIENVSLPAISQREIDYSTYDTIGFFDQTNNGFRPTMWENSEFDDIEFLMSQLSSEYKSNTISALLNKTLLTISTPPKKNINSNKNFLALKTEYYLLTQNDKIIIQILDQISQEDWSDADLINYINHHLILKNHKKVCVKKFINNFKNKKTKLLYQTFCKTMSNNIPAADLLLSLLQEQGQVDKEFIYLINTYINAQEIDLDKIKFPNLLKLSLINNKNIDFSKLINEESDLVLKKYFALSNLKTTEKKIEISEELIQKNLINSNILASNYKKYISENNIFDTSTYESKNDMEKRIFLFSEIRKNSDQKYLTKLAEDYVNEMKSSNMLYSTYDLIYDKIKVITPSNDLSDKSLNICILLILNDDNDKCNQWAQSIKFNKKLNIEYSLIKYYLYLNSENISEPFDQKILNNIISSDDVLGFNKNIIVKYIETTSQIKFPNYWKSKSELNKISTVVPNIKTIEYLKNVSKRSVGEAALLIIILHGNNEITSLDDFSIFAVLDSLYLIDSKTLKKLILEINIKTIIL